MEWIEVIQLRPYAKRDREKAVWAFRQLSLSKNEKGLEKISLFQGLAFENELSLRLHWRNHLPQNGKSGLGRQLVETFSVFGQIYHSGWIRMDEHNITLRRCINAEQTAL